MVEYLDIHKTDLIATRVSDKISNEEFTQLKNDIEEKIELYGKVKWYYEMVDFHGWDLKVFFEDIIFSLKNAGKFKKIAFVGENFLEKSMAEISKIFTPAEIKYFPLEKREEAIEWIK